MFCRKLVDENKRLKGINGKLQAEIEIIKEKYTRERWVDPDGKMTIHMCSCDGRCYVTDVPKSEISEPSKETLLSQIVRLCEQISNM